MGLFQQLHLILGAVALILGAAALFRRRASRKAAAQLARLEQLAAAGTVVAGVVHEAKNPLNGIVGFAQLGQGSTDPAEMREYFMLIEQDALRANALLEGMLDFTRATDGSARVSLPVNELVESALQLGRPQLALWGVTLETRLSSDPLPPIEGDANQLRQVLLNLLLNAGQAVAEAAVKRVVVTTAPGVEVVVEDSGPGLTEEAKRQAFTAFFTTKPRGQGTGLGLWVSRNLAEAHGGTLRIDNAPGGGARVTLRLPPGPLSSR